MEVGASPRVSSSRKRVVYKASTWRVHNFEIWSGELVCKAVALRVEGALLLWLGGGGAVQLGEVALGMPGAAGQPALSTALLGAAGAEGAAAGAARRLAVALNRPVYVCSALAFDRFTMPLVERGLIAEIKSRPEYFQ